MGDDMCISEREYRALLKVSSEARDIARVNASTLVELNKDVCKISDAVFGNGHVGMRAEVEALKVRTGLSDQHVAELMNAKLEGKIDWKWIVGLLLNGSTLVFLAAHILK